MKKSKIVLTFTLVFICLKGFSQTEFTKHKAGHTFDINLPDYMNKTAGLNDVAAIQYKNEVKDVYGIIIFDTKEELKLVELNYSSINEFYDDFINGFLIDEDQKTISKSKSQKIGEINFIECDASYYDKQENIEIYYLVGIVETKTSFYKVLSWTLIENKDKFKSDFQKILYSLRD